MNLALAGARRSIWLPLALFGLAIGLESASDAQAQQPRPYTYTPAHNKRLNEFDEHVADFVVRHEIGHMYISEYKMTVFGEDESVADDYAAYVTAVFNGSVHGLDTSRDLGFNIDAVQSLIDVAKFWKAFAAFEESDARAHGRDLAERHPPAEQRAARVACFLYGLSPNQFASVADRFSIKDRDACVRDAARRLKENREVFSSKETPCNRDLSSCPSVGIIAEPIPKGDRASEIGAGLVQHLGIALEASDRLAHRRLPEGMKRYNPKGTRPDDTLTGTFPKHLEPGDPEIALVNYRVYTRACPAAVDYNAYWQASTRSLTICYHLIDLIDEIGKTIVMDEDR